MIYCGLQILIRHIKLMIRQSNISLKWLGAYVFSFYDSKFLFGLEGFFAFIFLSWRGRGEKEKIVEASNISACLL